MDVDLVVIGAGLAGSCLATAVAREGWSVALLERGKGPRHKVCGEFLSPEAQGSLAGLGLHGTVAALQPAEMTGAQLVSRRGLRMGTPLPGVAWGISRYRLDTALSGAAAAAGATVLEGVAGSGVTREGAGYVVDARGEQGERLKIRARTAAVACGRHQPQGLRASVADTGGRQRYVGVKAHYEGVNLPPEVLLYMFDGGYVGLSPIEGGRANLCMLASEESFQRAGKTIPAMLEAVARWNPALARDLAGGTVVPETMVAVGAVDTGRPTALWEGCARLGDAATMIPPLCGDGQAMAIRAAEICAPLVDEVLRGRRSLAEWEQAYSAAWRRDFDGPLRNGRMLQSLLGRDWLGDGIVALGGLLPALAARAVHATRGPLRGV